ncbi:lamin tail domain-containing protein [Streptomyces sp. NBC_00715]|uniref:lamin tail domain-containing protein n=1 Tax=Streptomyces sp. NBC_00715 TaxID=2975811 RepID=UPI002F90D8C0
MQYDSPGWDNRSLNQEWAEITNPTRHGVNLDGWTLADEDSHTYTFDPFRLADRVTVHVHPARASTPDATSTRAAVTTCKATVHRSSPTTQANVPTAYYDTTTGTGSQRWQPGPAPAPWR